MKRRKYEKKTSWNEIFYELVMPIVVGLAFAFLAASFI